jgi:hypothetical protein
MIDMNVAIAEKAVRAAWTRRRRWAR